VVRLASEVGKDLLNASETARKLRLSVPHVYTMAAAGTLPSIKFGRAVRFDPADVEHFIEAHRRGVARPKNAA
jgi:excisionase family DNA binding protein